MSYVYFITSASAVKIGWSSDPAFRLKQLQTGNPARLRIACLAPGGEDLEKELHTRFRPHRLRGEWFRLCSVIEDFMTEKLNEKEPRISPDGMAQTRRRRCVNFAAKKYAGTQDAEAPLLHRPITDGVVEFSYVWGRGRHKGKAAKIGMTPEIDLPNARQIALTLRAIEDNNHHVTYALITRVKAEQLTKFRRYG